jgi:adenosine deaminase CECR1
MMKGLFNYETAYREYTQKCLEEFQNDGVQYAEIRPNFMKTNQIWVDDGTKQLDNPRTMEVIIEEWKIFKNKYPDTKVCGMKVIYCTPRSFPPGDVWIALQECLKWMKGPFKDYIAGFDLVGEETKGKPLKAFIPQFLAWKRQCQTEGIDIPLLLHCGETLECGGETDGNLLDAVLLGAKRIGHGFALPRNPYLVKKFKDQNICVEVCPISNEVLGLTPRMNGHAMYELLANDVHCTVNSDNGTLFR